MTKEHKLTTMGKNLLNPKYKLYSFLKNNPPKWWINIMEDEDLYVEIRKDNIIDVYYYGGRVTQIKQGRTSINVTCHPKYIGQTDTSNSVFYTPNKNPRYQDCQIWLENRLDELKSNIRRFYSGTYDKENTSEKYIQGQLIKRNPDKYLDSEFAHRLYEDEGKTVRMDLVGIENNHLIFEELKRITDSRLRNEANNPEILEQMKEYRIFIQNNKKQLLEYYIALYNIKKGLGLSVPANVDINNLQIDEEPRLIIADTYTKCSAARIERIENIKSVLGKNGIVPIFIKNDKFK